MGKKKADSKLKKSTTKTNTIKKKTQAKNTKQVTSVKKKTSKKSEPKIGKKEENIENQKGEGEYIHFKSPKYFNYARKLSKLSNEQVLNQVEKYNFNLQEKIHTGNLLSNLSSKVCQQGEYSMFKKAFYKDLQKYNDFYNQCMSKTRAELQRICILNEMPKSATKDILSERVADGLLLGRIPKCPLCKGGRLRFNNQNGTYFCPGYIDGGYFYSDLGDDYIFCNRVYKFDEIQREKFIEK